MKCQSIQSSRRSFNLHEWVTVVTLKETGKECDWCWVNEGIYKVVVWACVRWRPMQRTAVCCHQVIYVIPSMRLSCHHNRHTHQFMKNVQFLVLFFYGWCILFLMKDHVRICTDPFFWTYGLFFPECHLLTKKPTCVCVCVTLLNEDVHVDDLITGWDSDR